MGIHKCRHISDSLREKSTHNLGMCVVFIFVVKSMILFNAETIFKTQLETCGENIDLPLDPLSITLLNLSEMTTCFTVL